MIRAERRKSQVEVGAEKLAEMASDKDGAEAIVQVQIVCNRLPPLVHRADPLCRTAEWNLS
jgi:hypothetical protein